MPVSLRLRSPAAPLAHMENSVDEVAATQHVFSAVKPGSGGHRNSRTKRRRCLRKAALKKLHFRALSPPPGLGAPAAVKLTTENFHGSSSCTPEAPGRTRLHTPTSHGNDHLPIACSDSGMVQAATEEPRVAVDEQRAAVASKAMGEDRGIGRGSRHVPSGRWNIFCR